MLLWIYIDILSQNSSLFCWSPQAALQTGRRCKALDLTWTVTWCQGVYPRELPRPATHQVSLLFAKPGYSHVPGFRLRSWGCQALTQASLSPSTFINLHRLQLMNHSHQPVMNHSHELVTVAVRNQRWHRFHWFSPAPKEGLLVGQFLTLSPPLSKSPCWASWSTVVGSTIRSWWWTGND